MAILFSWKTCLYLSTVAFKTTPVLLSKYKKYLCDTGKNYVGTGITNLRSISDRLIPSIYCQKCGTDATHEGGKGKKSV